MALQVSFIYMPFTEFKFQYMQYGHVLGKSEDFPLQAMMASGGVKVQLHSSLNLAPSGGE
jgi:hypothetical protein